MCAPFFYVPTMRNWHSVGIVSIKDGIVHLVIETGFGTIETSVKPKITIGGNPPKEVFALSTIQEFPRATRDELGGSLNGVLVELNRQLREVGLITTDGQV